METGMQNTILRNAMPQVQSDIPNPPYLATLDITSFRGISIGAVHWYGKIHIHNKSNSIGSGAPKHPLDGTELSRPVTKELAKELDEKDGDNFFQTYFDEGLTTIRFDAKQDVIDEAVSWFNDNFDETADVLVLNKDVKHPSEDYYETHLIVLSGPNSIAKKLTEAGGDYSAQGQILKHHKDQG